VPSYLYCNQIIKSNISIPELHQADRGKPELNFSLEDARQQSEGFQWSNQWLSSRGKRLLCYYGEDAFHLLRIPGVADFLISANLKEIFCYPLPEIPLDTIRHHLLDSVLPRSMAHKGMLMVHASAVRLEQGILIFLGDSGAGKSTLAGNFHQAGLTAIADDVVWIKENEAQQACAIPSYQGLRLWDDSLQVLSFADQEILSMSHYSAKKRVVFTQDESRNLNQDDRILALIALTRCGQPPRREVYLEPLSRRDAFMEIMNETLQLDSHDVGERTRRMQALGSLIPKLPVFRLFRPYDYALLPLVRQKILETVL
jgi:hypothetical protein